MPLKSVSLIGHTYNKAHQIKQKRNNIYSNQFFSSCFQQSCRLLYTLTFYHKSAAQHKDKTKLRNFKPFTISNLGNYYILKIYLSSITKF